MHHSGRSTTNTHLIHSFIRSRGEPAEVSSKHALVRKDQPAYKADMFSI